MIPIIKINHNDNIDNNIIEMKTTHLEMISNKYRKKKEFLKCRN